MNLGPHPHPRMYGESSDCQAPSWQLRISSSILEVDLVARRGVLHGKSPERGVLQSEAQSVCFLGELEQRFGNKKVGEKTSRKRAEPSLPG